MSTTWTSPALKSETWRLGRFCLRSPNHPIAVSGDFTFEELFSVCCKDQQWQLCVSGFSSCGERGRRRRCGRQRGAFCAVPVHTSIPQTVHSGCNVSERSTSDKVLLLLLFFSYLLVFIRVEFTVGIRPINSFRMIERHYFQGRLLKNFDFDFGFCIPNSRNTCEHIYEFPQLPDDLSESKWFRL